MRVVLYAEGSNETGRVEMPPLYEPRSHIAEAHLGAAHVLTRRSIARVTGQDERSVQFQAPLMPQGRPSRGSQLLNPKVLEKLLTWNYPEFTPDLAVVLVDADGSTTRRAELENIVADRKVAVPPAVIAVAVQEFESWLLADLGPLRSITGRSIDSLPRVENLDPGRAKHELLSHLGVTREEQHSARVQICRTCDLEIVARSNSSFRRYLEDLRQACSPNA